jgi:hypothetical protein
MGLGGESALFWRDGEEAEAVVAAGADAEGAGDFLVEVELEVDGGFAFEVVGAEVADVVSYVVLWLGVKTRVLPMVSR